ncbi:MAG: aspartate/glutamate racemase family protein [Alphaproteobacteria bacterium]|nr:aspartate/glutamate racemase family protein [Alphaproteobacteria bacterium]
MKTIGLIGGMSWESTAVYYQLINEAMRERLGGLHSGEIVLRSLDFDAVVRLQTEGRWDAAADMLASAGEGLVKAGAECVLICTNTMHLVSAPVAERAGVPLIDIIDETAEALKRAGIVRPLLLATRYTMEHGFYAERMKRHGITVSTPDEKGRQRIHDVIFDELCQGRIDAQSRSDVLGLVDDAVRGGADGVILGCTEISLLIDPDALPVKGFDSTRIHADAAVAFALAGAPQMESAA